MITRRDAPCRARLATVLEIADGRHPSCSGMVTGLQHRLDPHAAFYRAWPAKRAPSRSTTCRYSKPLARRKARAPCAAGSSLNHSRGRAAHVALFQPQRNWPFFRSMAGKKNHGFPLSESSRSRPGPKPLALLPGGIWRCRWPVSLPTISRPPGPPIIPRAASTSASWAGFEVIGVHEISVAAPLGRAADAPAPDARESCRAYFQPMLRDFSGSPRAGVIFYDVAFRSSQKPSVTTCSLPRVCHQLACPTQMPKNGRALARAPASVSASSMPSSASRRPRRQSAKAPTAGAARCGSGAKTTASGSPRHHDLFADLPCSAAGALERLLPRSAGCRRP